MCNLSQGVKEQGIEIGTERGLVQGVQKEKQETVFRLFKKKYPLSVIADSTKLTEAEVRQILSHRGQ